MADGVVANPGVGGATFATDDDGTAHHPYFKVEFGADNTQTPVSTANPLPVVQTGTHTVTGAGGTFPVTDSGGSLTVDNAGTFAVQVNGDALTSLQLIDDSIGAIGAAAPTKAQACGVVSGGNLELPHAISSAALQGDNLAFVGAYHMANASFNFMWDGSAFDLVRGTSADGLLVNLGTNNDVTVTSGTVTIGTSVTPGTGATHLGKAEDAAHSSGDTGVFLLAVRSDTAVATGQTDGDYTALVTDSTGRLHVNVGNTVTVASHAVTNAGTFAVQLDGNALTALQLIDDPVVQDDAAFTPGTTKVMMAGFEADESSTDSVDEGDGGAARMTLDRKVIVTPQPHTAGGLSIFRSLDLDETEEDVKTAAGQVYGAWVTNFATTTRYLKFYNATAANTTVGTTTPVITVAIPGNTSDDISAVLSAGGYGIAFDTAICVAVTTGLADNDTGAPAANDFLANIFYK